jgi:hypothetical protein
MRAVAIALIGLIAAVGHWSHCSDLITNMVGHTRVIRVGGPPLVYVCVHVHTRPSTGANTHTDRLSTQACWRHNKSFKNPQKNLGQNKIPLKALWDKGCSHVEPPLRQSPIETMLVLALTLFCVYITLLCPLNFFWLSLLLAYHMCYNKLCLIMNRTL